MKLLSGGETSTALTMAKTVPINVDRAPSEFHIYVTVLVVENVKTVYDKTD